MYIFFYISQNFQTKSYPPPTDECTTFRPDTHPGSGTTPGSTISLKGNGDHRRSICSLPGSRRLVRHSDAKRSALFLLAIPRCRNPPASPPERPLVRPCPASHFQRIAGRHGEDFGRPGALAVLLLFQSDHPCKCLPPPGNSSSHGDPSLHPYSADAPVPPQPRNIDLRNRIVLYDIHFHAAPGFRFLPSPAGGKRPLDHMLGRLPPAGHIVPYQELVPFTLDRHRPGHRPLLPPEKKNV